MPVLKGIAVISWWEGGGGSIAERGRRGGEESSTLLMKCENRGVIDVMDTRCPLCLLSPPTTVSKCPVLGIHHTYRCRRESRKSGRSDDRSYGPTLACRRHAGIAKMSKDDRKDRTCPVSTEVSFASVWSRK